MLDEDGNVGGSTSKLIKCKLSLKGDFQGVMKIEDLAFSKLDN